MEILEGKFKKDDNEETVYPYRCGGCGAKYKEKKTQCIKCLSINSIERIIEEKGEEKLEKKEEIKIAVKKPKSKEEELREWMEGLSGRSVEAEVPSVVSKKKEAIVIKVKERGVTFPQLKEEEKNIRLFFKIDSRIKKEINAAKLEINDFARWMGKNLDSGNKEIFEGLEDKLENSIKERIERIKKNPVVQREPEAVKWLINEIFKLDGDLSKFSFYEKELSESFERIKKSLRLIKGR